MKIPCYLLMLVGLAVVGASSPFDVGAQAQPSAPKPALTVQLLQGQRSDLPLKVSANGSITAWQEAVISSQANGLMLKQVRVNVGDVVKQGQVLATLDGDTVQAELAQVKASVAEAHAVLAEAQTNAQRARELQNTGALSAQQINQYLTAERTAQARLQAQQALARVQQLRLSQTQIKAPDDGVISSRAATVGAIAPMGQELFRLIRKGRLEWRAEVGTTDLQRLAPGMKAQVTPSGLTEKFPGTLRQIAPSLDPQTRNAIVYADLPRHPSLKAGMFARGEFELGNSQGLTLPQQAVVLREGFSYVAKVGPLQNSQARVTLIKVGLGRRVGDRVEVVSGLNPQDQVVASGGSFLADGDRVRVVATAAATPSSSRPATSASQKAVSTSSSTSERRP
jgi:HlyD family secretion protein